MQAYEYSSQEAAKNKAVSSLKKLEENKFNIKQHMDMLNEEQEI